MSKKTDQIKFMQAMFPNVKFVECKYIEEGQRVADDSKTIDHIADVSKKVSLTEQYKTGTLKNGFYYFDNGKNQYIVEYHNIKGIEGLDGVKVLAPVPSYEEWRHFTDPYFKGLTTQAISELAKKSIRLTTQHCEDNARIEKLEELLKECRGLMNMSKDWAYTSVTEKLLNKIDEALK